MNLTLAAAFFLGFTSASCNGRQHLYVLSVTEKDELQDACGDNKGTRAKPEKRRRDFFTTGIARQKRSSPSQREQTNRQHETQRRGGRGDTQRNSLQRPRRRGPGPGQLGPPQRASPRSLASRASRMTLQGTPWSFLGGFKSGDRRKIEKLWLDRWGTKGPRDGSPS